jgi:Protein of unknown function DUF262/Protein of unknown function (DUF1524)
VTGASRLVPELRTVRELFDHQGTVYTVPVYQRNYAWRAGQVEQLIIDIQAAMAAGDGGYFLGNLIVAPRDKAMTDYEVIDGQQRLTTLYLLLTFLAEQGAAPYAGHIGRLRYESRPRSAEALQRITAVPLSPASLTAEPAGAGNSGIPEGSNAIEQYMNQHVRGEQRGRFADFLRDKVTVVRVTLPSETDVNRYFEVMNTRGQQLAQVDIVKARLMSCLGSENERGCFAWIWDACADMDSYVQMSLTRGRPDQRAEVFGKDWSWLAATSFQKLLEFHSPADADSAASVSAGHSLTLDGALAKYAAAGLPGTGEDEGNERFRSTIDFPAFLLHVLKVKNGDDADEEGHLDDSRLIRRFADALPDGDSGQWVREFAFELLRCRNLFDNCILKRQFTATNGDDGDWSLQRLVRRESKNGPTPGYISAFAVNSAESEEDYDVDASPGDLLLLQSMLRVTYTSPRTMHWITKVLGLLNGSEPGTLPEARLVGVLRGYARGKVREVFPADGEPPTGFNVSRIVFTYLDYLLLRGNPDPGYRFSFRNSIEHFYPQRPDEQQSGTAISPRYLDLLGNLALVSVGANSKFSNSLPKAKAENFRFTIETQSPKLQEMADITRRQKQGWDEAHLLDHHKAMVNLLRADLSQLC